MLINLLAGTNPVINKVKPNIQLTRLCCAFSASIKEEKKPCQVRQLIDHDKGDPDEYHFYLYRSKSKLECAREIIVQSKLAILVFKVPISNEPKN